MKKIIFTIVIAGIFVAFTGCNSSESFLLLQSKYNPYDLEENPDNRANLKQVFRKERLDLITETMETEGDPAVMLDRISGMIEKPGVKYVLLDPLVISGIDKIIGKYPDRLFILFGRNESFHFPNLLNVQYDKTEALKKAGTITGMLLQQKYTLFRDRKAPGEKLKMGLIYYKFLPGQIEEINIFKEAFVNSYGEDEFLVEEVRDIHDRNDINAKIEKLIREGAVLIFPRLYLSNSYCLDLVIKKGGMVIIENWKFIHSHIDKNILFSINDSFLDSVQAILQVKNSMKNNTSRWEESAVNVNSRIIWCPDLEIPADAKTVLMGKN